MSEEITLPTVDKINFKRGITYEWHRGRMRRRSGWFGFRCAVADFAWRMTRWWRPRTVCSVIDREAGSITMVEERWSWRRWKWERA